MVKKKIIISIVVMLEVGFCLFLVLTNTNSFITSTNRLLELSNIPNIKNYFQISNDNSNVIYNEVINDISDKIDTISSNINTFFNRPFGDIMLDIIDNALTFVFNFIIYFCNYGLTIILVLYLFLHETFNGTQIDLTVDDYDGEYFDFNWIKAKLDKGNFTSTFQKKYYKLHGCAEEGYSIEFGSHSSTQMLVIYEKLKEQKKKKKEVNANYWLRLEMRYMHEKALYTCLDLLDKVDPNNITDSFNKYVLSILYQMLDIKIDNNYSLTDQSKVETDTKWHDFLNNVDKIKINKPKSKESTFDIFKKYILQTYYEYFIVIYLISKKDIYTTLISIIDDVLTKIDLIDNLKLKKINTYLDELQNPKIRMVDINNLKSNLLSKREELGLPF